MFRTKVVTTQHGRGSEMKRVRTASRLLPAILCVATSSASAAPSATTQPARRTVKITEHVVVDGLQAGQVARVWVPVPHDDPNQQVSALTIPADASIANEPRTGNTMVFVSAPAAADGHVEVSLAYQVTRVEATEQAAARDGNRAANSDRADLAADALVPIGGKPATLLVGHDVPADDLARGRMLYDLVTAHMTYRKDQPGWGRGDAAWACDSGFGNCTDFHSLFISLARTTHLPARFEIGYSLPTTESGPIPGYHCWAWFHPRGHDWIPVDASEASKHPEKHDYFFGHLDADRVTLSAGRDVTLVPKQDGPPLNFFAGPYAEVDGHACDSAHVRDTRAFTAITSEPAAEK